MRRGPLACALGLAGAGALLAGADAAPAPATGAPDDARAVVVPAGGSYVARPGG